VRWPPAWELVTWNSLLVVGQSPTGKDVSTEKEDIVGIRQQATAD
jgi:hypothetical protein